MFQVRKQTAEQTSGHILNMYVVSRRCGRACVVLNGKRSAVQCRKWSTDEIERRHGLAYAYGTKNSG